MSYRDYLGLMLPRKMKPSQVLDIVATEKGKANGIADLDGNGKVPSTELPSYVDDIVEYNSLNDFPLTGEAGKIYCDTSTTKIYRWSGSTYVEIPPAYSNATTSTAGLMSAEDKFKLDHASKTYRCICSTAADQAVKVITGMDSTISLDEEVVFSVRFVNGNTVTDNVKLQISGSEDSYPIWLFNSRTGGTNLQNFQWKSQQTVNFVYFGGGYRVLSTHPGVANASGMGYMTSADKVKLDNIPTVGNTAGDYYLHVTSNSTSWQPFIDADTTGY